MLSAIEKSIITSATKKRLEDLEEKQDELNGKILVEQTKTRMMLTKNDITFYIQKALKVNRNKLQICLSNKSSCMMIKSTLFAITPITKQVLTMIPVRTFVFIKIISSHRFICI